VNWEAEKEIWDRTFLETDSPVHVWCALRGLGGREGLTKG
jgi:hypothetical protein